MKEIEEWKPVLGFEGTYEVSNYGNIRSLDRRFLDKRNRFQFKKGKVLSCKTDKDGYKSCGLWKNGKRYDRRIHRLVWEAFYGKIENDLTINHKDEVRDNNYLGNLELMTIAENNNYGHHQENSRNTRLKLYAKRKAEKEQIIKEKKSRKKILYQYSIDGELIKKWDSVKEAQTAYKTSHISDCCLGRRNKTKGYIWMYSLMNNIDNE